MNRKEFADQILSRIAAHKDEFKEEFFTEKRVNSFYVDDVLEEKYAHEIFESYPKLEDMVLKHNLAEYKYIAVQMNKYNPILEEIIYAFQDPRIIQLISEITQIETLIPDSNLYAGGLSTMVKDHYLNPHVDNSHDKDRKYFR